MWGELKVSCIPLNPGIMLRMYTVNDENDERVAIASSQFRNRMETEYICNPATIELALRRKYVLLM